MLLGSIVYLSLAILLLAVSVTHIMRGKLKKEQHQNILIHFYCRGPSLLTELIPTPYFFTFTDGNLQNISIVNST